MTDSLHAHDAAIRIQALLRRRIAFKESVARRSAARKLQHWYVRHKTIVLFRKCHRALTALQARWRGHLGRKKAEKEKQRVIAERALLVSLCCCERFLQEVQKKAIRSISFVPFVVGPSYCVAAAANCGKACRCDVNPEPLATSPV